MTATERAATIKLKRFIGFQENPPGPTKAFRPEDDIRADIAAAISEAVLEERERAANKVNEYMVRRAGDLDGVCLLCLANIEVAIRESRP